MAMIRITMASHNQHKIREVRAILGEEVDLTGLEALGCDQEIPEPYDTLEQNALAKARYIFNTHQVNCFADDTGLEVMSLDNRPGVMSARYAGPGKNNQANIRKLLHELRRQINRAARFRTIIALIINGEEHLFEGVVHGSIAEKPSGEEGFGYDPVFIPDGYSQSFADMDPAEKNSISHRYAAISKLYDFLKQRSFAG